MGKRGVCPLGTVGIAYLIQNSKGHLTQCCQGSEGQPSGQWPAPALPSPTRKVPLFVYWIPRDIASGRRGGSLLLKKEGRTGSRKKKKGKSPVQMKNEPWLVWLSGLSAVL